MNEMKGIGVEILKISFYVGKIIKDSDFRNVTSAEIAPALDVDRMYHFNTKDRIEPNVKLSSVP